MECLNITFEEAEQLRKKLVLSVNASDDDDYEISRGGNIVPISMKKANDITYARLEMMAQLIQKCIKTDDDTLPYYLTGGGISYIKGAKEILSSCLDKNVNILYPKDLHLNKPHYSALLGMAEYVLSTRQDEKEKSFISRLLEKIIKR